MNIEEWAPLIVQDFAVLPIAIKENNAVYARRRERVWHFVRQFKHDSRITLEQFHFCRYEVARQVKSEVGTSTDAYAEAINDLFYERTGMNFLNRPELPAQLAQQIAEDVRALDVAQRKVEDVAGEYQASGVRTQAGHAVTHKSREFMDAIQFENVIHGSLDARRFGIYSAYCTYRSFILGKGISIEMARGLVDGQLAYAPENISGDYVDLVLQMQKECLGEVYWGPDVKVRRDRFVQAVHDTLNRLTAIQQTQFVLSSGMQNDGLFLPLGLAAAVLTNETYNYFQTANYQADSMQEQQVRTDAAIIWALASFDDEDD